MRAGVAVALCLCLSMFGCAGAPGGPRSEAPPGRTVWQGQVRIAEDITFPRGSELVLEPGTVVRFAFRDDDGDGWGDASLRVEGALIARGTPEEPVVFTSENAPAEPGSWGEIRIDFGSFHLSHVLVEGSTRGLHTHFSRGRVEDSVFRRNVDGTRFGESAVEVERCLFAEHPGKAMNSRRCRNRVMGNLFRGNRHGIFLFEADAGSAFEANHFRDNEAPFYLGDFFEGTVDAGTNDWGGALPAAAPDNEAARILAAFAPAPEAGPRGWPLLEELWRAELGGFVDAPPVPADEGVYAASWNGALLRLGFLDGAVLASVSLPDAVDAPPALGPGVVAAACWDRGLYLLRRGSLEVLDVHAEAPSPADDHRQSGPVFLGTTLVAAGWSGTVRAFETSGGRLEPLWSFPAGGPFRADLRTARAGARTLILAPSQDGNLYALDPVSGQPAWVYRAGAPLLSAPAVGEETVYLADRAGTLHAVALAGGTARWTRRLAGGAWYAPPLLLDEVLYQGEDSGTLWAIAAGTGQVLWRRPLGAGVRARPAEASPGLLAVPTVGGRLVLLDGETGFERDALSLGEPFLSTPEERGGRVFLGGRDGHLRALGVRRLPASGEGRAR
ncbi:MAG: PQQ-binding-like beta-propeller repeat protein [Thermodesulfobacteriota bacterium]